MNRLRHQVPSRWSASPSLALACSARARARSRAARRAEDDPARRGDALRSCPSADVDAASRARASRSTADAMPPIRAASLDVDHVRRRRVVSRADDGERRPRAHGRVGQRARTTSGPSAPAGRSLHYDGDAWTRHAVRGVEEHVLRASGAAGRTTSGPSATTDDDPPHHGLRERRRATWTRVADAASPDDRRDAVRAVWGSAPDDVRIGARARTLHDPDRTSTTSGNQFIEDRGRRRRRRLGAGPGDRDDPGYLGQLGRRRLAVGRQQHVRRDERGIAHGRRRRREGRATLVWTRSTASRPSSLEAIWGSSANDVWAVGDARDDPHDRRRTRSLGRSSRRRRRRRSTPSGAAARTTSGRSATPGTILHYDGAAWTPSTRRSRSEEKPNLYGVWGSGPNDVWIVGDGVALHYTGPKPGTGRCQVNRFARSLDVARRCASSSCSSRCARRAPTPVSETTTRPPTRRGRSARRTLPATEAASDARTTPVRRRRRRRRSDRAMCSDDGFCHTALPAGARRCAASGATAPASSWAVSEEGDVLRWDGTAWSVHALEASGALYTIWGSGPTDIWVGGETASSTARAELGCARRSRPSLCPGRHDPDHVDLGHAAERRLGRRRR